MEQNVNLRLGSIKNTAQISGSNVIHIAFSKLTGSPLLTANRFKTRTPNLMWMELKKELSMQFSVIQLDTYATNIVTQLEQGLDELIDDYLHHVNELLSIIYHTSDMSSILAEDTNHYTVVYGLSCRKLKDNILGNQSREWKTMDGCFRFIHVIVARYEQAKGYCRTKLNIPDTSCITEIKTMMETDPCY